VNISAEAVELGNRDVALELPSSGERGLELGTAV